METVIKAIANTISRYQCEKCALNNSTTMQEYIRCQECHSLFELEAKVIFETYVEPLKNKVEKFEIFTQKLVQDTEHGTKKG